MVRGVRRGRKEAVRTTARPARNAGKARGFANVEHMLEQQASNGYDLQQRQDAVRRIDSLRERLFLTYGAMPDSTGSIREDRAR